jgi:acyl-CoA reductase-like NAD-dependent aldehyde dehydrogenase
VVGRINNNGQCCVASKRFIAVESIAKSFLEKFKNKLSQLVIGDPMEADTQLGPLCTEEAATKISEQVKRAVNAGAEKVTEALAFPAVADPIIGASGLRPSWESVIPMFSIFELYHSIKRFSEVLRN